MKKNNGFTFIEVMTATAILSILLLGAVSVFTTTLLSQSKARVRRMLKLEGEQIINTIDFELKNAQAITSPCNGVATPNIQYLRTGDTSNTTREIAQSGATDISAGPVGNLTPMNSNKVKTSAALSFVCEENPTTNAKYISVSFALTNAQAGEINTDSGSISESFRTGVSFRNFKAN